MKKNLFGLNFDQKSQPGHETRNFSMDALFGKGKIDQTYPKFESKIADKRDLRKVFNSRLDIRTLPSAWSMFKKVR